MKYLLLLLALVLTSCGDEPTVLKSDALTSKLVQIAKQKDYVYQDQILLCKRNYCDREDCEAIFVSDSRIAVRDMDYFFLRGSKKFIVIEEIDFDQGYLVLSFGPRSEKEKFRF